MPLRVDGTTFRACLPDAALENPRMFSEGSLISSISFLPPPSVSGQRKFPFQIVVDVRRFGQGLFFKRAKRLTPS